MFCKDDHSGHVRSAVNLVVVSCYLSVMKYW